MSFLLDTNVVSEWTKPRPNPGIIEWLAQVEEGEVFLSVVTFAELRHGIERLPAGARRRRLDTESLDVVQVAVVTAIVSARIMWPY